MGYNSPMAQTKEQAPLLAAYLVVGEDALKRQTVIARLRKRLSSEGDMAFNCDEFDGETATGAEVVAACNTLPFASDVRLVLVRNAEKLKKADADEVVEYLNAPSETTVLALEAEKLAKNTRLYKAVAALGKQAIIDCAPPKSWELPRQVRAMAPTHGFVLTEGAANALVELVGENTIALDNELKKLALAHEGSDAVTEREVRGLVARVNEAKPWDFTAAFAERNLSRCLSLLGAMESTAVQVLLALCVTRIRELMAAQSFERRGSLRDLAAALKVPDWRVKHHGAWAHNYSSAELRQALRSSRDCELAMKSGGDPEALFRDWLIGVLRR